MCYIKLLLTLILTFTIKMDVFGSPCRPASPTLMTSVAVWLSALIYDNKCKKLNIVGLNK